MDARLIDDPPAEGAWNMAVDETLLLSASERGVTTLRLYRWLEPTVSLGYFQSHADRALHSASANCPFVRRATGGGAIVHDRELTYSFTTPITDRFRNVDELYRVFHQALIDVWKAAGIDAELAGDPAGASKTQPQPPFLCFQRRSEWDIVIGPHKVVGSAQRRHHGAVLQHGSILLSRSAAAQELPGIRDVASLGEFASEWMSRVENSLGLTFVSARLDEGERRAATELAASKFGSPHWNERR